MTRRVRHLLLLTLVCASVLLASACTEYQQSVFRSLAPNEQQAVARYMNEQRPSSDGSCVGATHAVWPSDKWAWAEKIISRESGGNPSAQNRSSSAAGCFQIVRGTWNANAACPWASRYNADCNVRTAWILYQRSGGSPWVTNY